MTLYKIVEFATAALAQTVEGVGSSTFKGVFLS